jgi:glutathione S-transferase
MLTLYMSPGTSSMATHIALNEAGAPFEMKALSLAKKETRTADYLAVNPAGKVPALLIDGRLLTEVAGTLWYIARRWPEAKLLPAGDIEAEAQIVSWMSYLASTVHPARSKGDEAAIEAWKLTEQKLARREWVAGNAYSIADIHLFRLYWRFSGALNLPAGTLPTVEAHYKRMMARPAVIKTIAAEKALGYELPA